MGTNRVSARVGIGGPIKPDGTYETDGTYVSDRTESAALISPICLTVHLPLARWARSGPGFEGDLTLIIKKATDL